MKAKHTPKSHMGQRKSCKINFLKIQTHKNKIIILQNLGDVEKAVLRGKCLILNAYIGKKKKALNHLCFYFRKLERNKLNLSYVDENNKNLRKK